MKQRIAYQSKIDDLYKYCSQGWSIRMSESKAGLEPRTDDYYSYQDSEHFERIRKMYGKKNRSFFGSHETPAKEEML